MNMRSVRSLRSAMLIAVGVAGYLMTSAPADSAGAIKVENKALAAAIKGAQADAKAGHFAEALAKAKTADAISAKPAQLTRQVHEMIVAYAIKARDYSSALTELDKMIAANEGDRNKNMSNALAISLQSGNQQRAMNYAKQLGSNLGPQERLYIAQGYFKANKFKEALSEVQPLREGHPSEALLLFLQSVYDKMNDRPNRRASLEELVTDYPKPQYWHDLLQIARNERGLTDEQSLDIDRLRRAVGDLKTDDDYMEMAQLALVAGYPNEAKSVLDEAAAAKLLMGERDNRLVKMTNDRVAQDHAVADLEKRADADPDASVKLGLVYWTYGKNKEAEESIRNGMMHKLADPEAAKQALGHVLLSSDKKPEALAAFNSVAKNGKQAGVSRLWSIYVDDVVNHPKDAIASSKAESKAKSSRRTKDKASDS